MFCPKCGNKANDGALFCDRCGYKFDRSDADKQESGGFKITPAVGWVALAICFLMLIVGLSVSLSYDKIEGPSDLIVPVIFSLISLGASVFILSYSKKEKATNAQFKTVYYAAIIVVVLSALLALEVCLGPLIGELTKK